MVTVREYTATSSVNGSVSLFIPHWDERQTITYNTYFNNTTELLNASLNAIIDATMMTTSSGQAGAMTRFGFTHVYKMEDGETLTLSNGNYFKSELSSGQGRQVINAYLTDNTYAGTVYNSTGLTEAYCYTIPSDEPITAYGPYLLQMGLSLKYTSSYVRCKSDFTLTPSNFGNILATFMSEATPTPTDPYGWTEPTGPSTPISQHTIVHNDVDFPSLPTATLADAGFVSLWTPTKEQLQSLARYMWTIDITSIDFWKKLVASPLELIFGLSIIPYDVHDDDSPYHVYQDSLTMGYVNTHIDMDYIEEQFIEVDFGSVDLTEYIGAYLDYDPYTKFSIFLPYIGVKDLSADDIMNRTISLKYRIDLASGACVAMIKCAGSDPVAGAVDSVFYSFSGSCSAQVPVSASQQQELVRSIVSIGVGVAATAATIFTGGLTAVGAATAVGATANGALGLKSHYAHSGNMGSTAGFMGVQQPYLIVSRPRLAIPGDQNVYMGYPSFITMTLGDLSGYTEVEVTHLDRLSCTEEEMSEIAELLKKGVYF